MQPHSESVTALLGSLTFENAVAAGAARVARVDASDRRPSSGTIVGEDLVVIAAHALEREDGIPVHLPASDDPTRTQPPVAGRLLGADPHLDLAVLHVAGARVPEGTAAFGPTDGLRLGALVFAVARPGRVRASVSIVSALDGAWRTGGGSVVDRWIETELGGWPGFSGSPLVGADGAVLGVNTWGLMRHRGLVLPGTTIERAVAEIRAHGRVRRGWLGIGAQPVRLPASSAAAQGAGLLIASIAPDSPAERSGLLLGDVLLAYGAAALGRVEDLVVALDASQIDAQVTVRVLRAGEVHERVVNVGGR